MCRDWAAIVLNAPYPLPPVTEPFVIAADGGARHVSAPDLWVGDGDSSIPSEHAEHICVPAEKDFTDGELALALALQRGFCKIRIYGVTGGKPDQEFNNYALLLSATRSGAEAEGIGEGVKVVYFEHEVTVSTKKGTVISLIPFYGAAIVRAKRGLKYPLNDLELKPEAMGRGVSNVATEEEVAFEMRSGGALLFIYDPLARIRFLHDLESVTHNKRGGNA